MADAAVVQVLALSEAAIVVDSSYRTSAAESPGNFAAVLPGAIRDGKRVHHQSLSWAQSMYAHTRETMLIRLRIYAAVTPPTADDWFYCFMTPYYMFTSPDGTDETVPFATPIDCSYAADLEAALNNAMYILPVTPSIMRKLVYPPGVSFSVRYSKGSGFLIECANSTFQIHQESSTWLQQAHDVHGFGERVSNFGKILYASPTIAGPVSAITSATAPNLMSSRFIGIACPELAQRRQMSSFSNVNSPAFGSAEINVFSTSYKDNGAWKTKSTPSDPTVLNMNPSDGVGQLTMGMYNNQGVQVNAGNPWTFFIAMFLTAPQARTIAAVTRAAAVENCLVNMWSNGTMSLQAYPRLAFDKIGGNVLCKADELMHKILVQSER